MVIVRIMTFSIKLKIQHDLISTSASSGYLGCGKEDDVNNNVDSQQVTSEM